MGKEKELMLKNGGMLLEELISSCNGRCNPIRSFSANQLLKATNNFGSPCYIAMEDKWYKAILDNHPVLIKKFETCTRAWQACRDIVVSSIMSSHKNVLKLLGCCLEFPLPVLVYEHAENGPLNKWGSTTISNDSNGSSSSSSSSSLSWKMRLKIAKEIANALTYLHIQFSRPIIHRNINPQSVFLDKDYVAKLSDFSLSITIPEGQNHAEDAVIGTFGFVDPDYVSTRFVTEKTDVYSFGRFMVTLLIGLRKTNQDYNLRPEFQLIRRDCLTEIVDRNILEEEGGGSISEEQQLQLQAYVELALRCVEVKGEDRPRMIDVAKELRRIEKSTV